MGSGIEHVFVLMLENRSFDHMLGFSDITGTDAVSGRVTKISGLTPPAFSLLQVVRSWRANALSAVVKGYGRNWPPPPTIPLRDLLTSNTFQGHFYRAASPADYAMPVDPGHE